MITSKTLHDVAEWTLVAEPGLARAMALEMLDLRDALTGLSHDALGQCWCPSGGPIADTHELHCAFARHAMGIEQMPCKEPVEK